MSATIPRESTAPSIQTPTLSAAPPKHRPNMFGRRWVALLLATDVSMFGVAALAASAVVKGTHYLPAPPDSIFTSFVIYAAFWLIIFERLGLYRRSFAWSVRDEIYNTVAALALGAVPQFFLFTLVPSVSSSRSVLLLSMAFASVTVGGSRAVLHEMRTRLRARFPQRVAVVGHASRLDAALASLNFSSSTRVLPLCEPDVEATLRSFDLTHDSNLYRIPWLRQARAWGSETILLTEVLPPHVLPVLL
ncbi:MAG: hypothetical protein JO199_14760, partial [Candidatus Eremiobacteraeota bacterium]|nr:hypothetical protein [Candidatus Eremiobacteraeota bacterium]